MSVVLTLPSLVVAFSIPMGMQTIRLACMPTDVRMGFAAHAPPRSAVRSVALGMEANVDWKVGVPADVPLGKPFGRESVLAAIDSLKRGEVICVTDDESRENEGDLIMACEYASPNAIGFIVRYTGGVLCASVPEERLQQLKLPVMYENNEDPKGTAFHVTADAKAYDGHESSTGISAADRAATFRAIADPDIGPEAFCRPGHVFPLRTRARGAERQFIEMPHAAAASARPPVPSLTPSALLIPRAQVRGPVESASAMATRRRRSISAAPRAASRPA